MDRRNGMGVHIIIVEVSNNEVRYRLQYKRPTWSMGA